MIFDEFVCAEVTSYVDLNKELEVYGVCEEFFCVICSYMCIQD